MRTRMRNLTMYVTLALLCTITFTGQSADTPLKKWINTLQQPAPEKQKPKFQVEVSVGCKDENTKAFIESHIKRELRSLQDVEITDVGKYELSIATIEGTFKTSGRKTGDIALGWQFQRRYSPAVEIIKLSNAYPAGTKARTALRDASLEQACLREV